MVNGMPDGHEGKAPIVLMLITHELTKRILSESLRWQDKISTQDAADVDDCIAKLEGRSDISAVIVDLDGLGRDRARAALRIVAAAGLRRVQFLSGNPALETGDAVFEGRPGGIIPKATKLKDIRQGLLAAA